MRNYNQNQHSTGGFSIGPGMISPFIKVMLIANTALFILQNIVPELTAQLGLVPAIFFNDFPNKLFQPFTYMFLHGGFFHLLFNMFILWMFGTEIELTWGSKKFGRFYILSGLFGALLTLIVQSDQLVTTVGASAAIYGVLIAYWLMFPNRMLYIYFLVPVKVKWAIPGIMLLGFLAGGANVAHMAHLGGALFAFVYMKISWRWLHFGNYFRNLSYRREEAKLNKNRQKAENIMKRVDEILDRINDVGIDNITPEERRFLEDASLKLSEKESSEER